MKWIILFLICFSISEQNSVFEAVEENSHFTILGKVKVFSERADLVIDVELDQVTELIKQTCALSSHLFLNNTDLAPQVRRRFGTLCGEDVVRWDSIAGQVHGRAIPEDRQPQFVVLAVVSAIAGGVLGQIWGEQADAEKIKTLAAEQDRLVTVLDQIDARIKVDEDHT